MKIKKKNTKKIKEQINRNRDSLDDHRLDLAIGPRVSIALWAV